MFVLGGSGTLTRYSLLPRPHEEAREGDDAPIAIDCHAHFSWRLLRYSISMCVNVCVGMRFVNQRIKMADHQREFYYALKIWPTTYLQ